MGAAARGLTRTRVPGVSPSRERLCDARCAGTVSRAVRKADRREPAELAREARARAPPRRTGPPRRRAVAAVRRARDHSPRAHAATGHLGDALRPEPPAGPRLALRRPHARGRLLPRSARLPALPLPLDGTDLAVPALPRVEHVCGGADRDGERERGSLRRRRRRVFL